MKTENDNGGSGDATWILTCAFITFSMQSGFGLLEAVLPNLDFETNRSCCFDASNLTALISNLCKMVKIKTENDNGGSGDATWILTSAFIIFTMQSGFGLLEAGFVSSKNECNIMIKNMIDVIFGGLAYWLFGYGLSFGTSAGTNGFVGVGNFLTDADQNEMGPVFAKYFFQLSFATTATTIVSGAMAERTNLVAYMMYSFINTFTYVFPAHWMWYEKGFLHKMGAIDIAGAGPVHLVGGVSALLATLYLKPRTGRFDGNYEPEMASPTTAVLGTFMLWWGWLGFNCGSTFGVSNGKWKLATRAAINTINASIGGGIFAIMYSCWLNKKYKRKLNVPVFTSGLLGGLVGITGICTLCRPWEAVLIGMIGSVLACTGIDLLEWLKIDDPVGCIPVHGFTGIWSMIAVGLFAKKESEHSEKASGLFESGDVKLLGVQTLACVCIMTWAAFTNIIELIVVDKVCGLRVSLEEEELGADFCEHGISSISSNKAMQAKYSNKKPTRIFRCLCKEDEKATAEQKEVQKQCKINEAYQIDNQENEAETTIHNETMNMNEQINDNAIETTTKHV